MFSVQSDAVVTSSYQRVLVQLAFQPTCYVFMLVFIDRYTLGGFYLARYDDSPAGEFDEVGLGNASIIACTPLLHIVATAKPPAALGMHSCVTIHHCNAPEGFKVAAANMLVMSALLTCSYALRTS